MPTPKCISSISLGQMQSRERFYLVTLCATQSVLCSLYHTVCVMQSKIENVRTSWSLMKSLQCEFHVSQNDAFNFLREKTRERWWKKYEMSFLTPLAGNQLPHSDFHTFVLSHFHLHIVYFTHSLLHFHFHTLQKCKKYEMSFLTPLAIALPHK